MNRIKFSLALTILGLIGAFATFNDSNTNSMVEKTKDSVEYLIFNKDGEMVYRFEKSPKTKFSEIFNNGFVNSTKQSKQEYYYVLNNISEDEIYSGKIYL